MSYWAWWQGGVVLAGVMVLHWLVLGRMMGVSGRYTALIDRWRAPPPSEAEEALTAEELSAALRELTAAEFGEGALEAPLEPAAPAPVSAAPLSLGTHALFFGALVAGGLLSAVLGAGWTPSFAVRGAGLTTLVEGRPWLTPLLLGGGGVLVGFGTRMAAGCTSGHGLCGTSRLQPGSLLATAAFFAAGVGTSFLLQRWL